MSYKQKKQMNLHKKQSSKYPMSDNISALLDGEIDEEELDDTYKFITNNRTDWDVYHLIGDVLRNPSDSTLSFDQSQNFIDKCAKAIAAESLNPSPITNLTIDKNKQTFSHDIQENFSHIFALIKKNKLLLQNHIRSFFRSNSRSFKYRRFNRSNQLVRAIPTAVASAGAIVLMWSLLSPIENNSSISRISRNNHSTMIRNALPNENWSLGHVITNGSYNTISNSAFKEFEPYINAHQQLDSGIFGYESYP